MYRLYAIPGTCSTGIHVLLNKLGQEVEIVNRDDVVDYEKLVPTNQVPALVDGDELLTEGSAIVFHLMEKHGVAPLPGRETREFRQWLLFNYATLHATYSKLFMVGVVNDIQDESVRKQLINHVAERLSVLWGIVETRLEGRKFMVGESATVIDYLLSVYANWGNAVPDAYIEIGPRTRDLIKKVVALPEFASALQREGFSHILPE